MTKPEKLEASRAWKKANPERHAELMRAYRQRNREKTIAQNRLNHAISKGRIARQPCEVCGTDQKVHAHHHDYSKPLDVHWLCYVCHKAAHPVTDEDKCVKFSGAKHARLPGTANPNASLDLTDVYIAKFFLRLGCSQQTVADIVGVAQTTISRLALGRTYSA